MRFGPSRSARPVVRRVVAMYEVNSAVESSPAPRSSSRKSAETSGISGAWSEYVKPNATAPSDRRATARRTCRPYVNSSVTACILPAEPNCHVLRTSFVSGATNDAGGGHAQAVGGPRSGAARRRLVCPGTDEHLELAEPTGFGIGAATGRRPGGRRRDRRSKDDAAGHLDGHAVELRLGLVLPRADARELQDRRDR